MKNLMEKLVFDVVLSVIGDEAIGLTLKSDFAVLDVDQLDITYIVLALETRLGIELPTHLEDARTVAELVTGARNALRANVVTTFQLPKRKELPPTASRRSALRRPSRRRPLRQNTTVSPSIDADRAAREQTRRGRALARTAAPRLVPDDQLGEAVTAAGGHLPD